VNFYISKGVGKKDAENYYYILFERFSAKKYSLESLASIHLVFWCFNKEGYHEELFLILKAIMNKYNVDIFDLDLIKEWTSNLNYEIERNVFDRTFETLKSELKSFEMLDKFEEVND